MMNQYATMEELTRQDAIRVAYERTISEGRKFVVRVDNKKYFVVPLYEEGAEGKYHDAGYASLGALVEESLFE